MIKPRLTTRKGREPKPPGPVSGLGSGLRAGGVPSPGTRKLGLKPRPVLQKRFLLSGIGVVKAGYFLGLRSGFLNCWVLFWLLLKLSLGVYLQCAGDVEVPRSLGVWDLRFGGFRVSGAGCRVEGLVLKVSQGRTSWNNVWRLDRSGSIREFPKIGYPNILP